MNRILHNVKIDFHNLIRSQNSGIKMGFQVANLVF